VTGSRIIRLRRPPVVVATEGRFVPPGIDLDVVDRRWNALCAANPKYFDGAMLQVLGTSRNGHGGVQIHVQECSYRFYAVQRADGDWPGLDCGVRPLGVKGIAYRAIGPDGRREVLVGRRSQRVAFYPGLWEFVPGGGLEPGIDPAQQVVKELDEEAGLSARSAPIAIALVADPVAFTWEVVHRLELADGTMPELGWEYDEFRFVAPDALPEPLADVARQMRALV